MKNLSQYLVALALAFGAIAVTSIDVQARVVCGPNGCYHVYPHRSQWPVGQGGGITLPRDTTDTIGIARSGLWGSRSPNKLYILGGERWCLTAAHWSSGVRRDN